MRSSLAELTAAAEAEWLAGWTSGRVEAEGAGLAAEAPAPDLVLLDDTGARRSLSEFWSDGPALVMFWRHFGCGYGAERARRPVDEGSALRDAGLNPVVIGQGEPARAAAYRMRHGLS